MGDLVPGQHVAGTVAVSLNLDSLAGRIDRVVLRVDDQEVATVRQRPYAFTLATPSFPTGDHVVSVSVYVRNSAGGLLALVGAPDVLFVVPVVFDQRRPTPVSLTSVDLQENRPYLTWAQSQDANFYAYVVYRRPTESEAPETWPGVEVATLFDRTQTAFLDEMLPAVYGSGATYRVAVWNRQDHALSNTALTARYGTSVPNIAPTTGLAIQSRNGQSLYYVAGPRFAEASLDSRRIVRFLDLPSNANLYRFENDIHIDPTTGRIVAAVRGAGVRVVDAGTFEPVATYSLPYQAYRFALSGGKLYTVDWYEYANRLLMLDAETGAVVAMSGVLEAVTTAVVGASPDGRSVYVVDAPGWTQTSLTRYDVSGASPVPAERVPLGYSVYDWDVTVAEDGRVVAFIDGAISVFDGPTLARRPETVIVPASGLAEAVRVRGDRLYATYRGSSLSIPGAGEVAEYDASSLRLLRRWQFAEAPRGIAFGAPGELLVFSPSATWSVSL